MDAVDELLGKRIIRLEQRVDSLEALIVKQVEINDQLLKVLAAMRG